MKNENEKFIDGKLYIEKIKSCVCKEQSFDSYVLTCKIHQRGEHNYSCGENPEYIEKYPGSKGFWLSENAQNTIGKAIKKYKRQIKNALIGATEVRVEELNLTVYYKRVSKSRYNIVADYDSYHRGIHFVLPSATVDYTGTYRKKGRKFFRRVRIDEAMWRFRLEYGIDELNDGPLFKPTLKNIDLNPFYASAKAQGDLLLQLQIKQYYGVNVSEETSMLSEKLGRKILPALPEEFDKEYYVDVDTISLKYHRMLKDSGYEISHRPYFAMRLHGVYQTHSIWTLNPHTKAGVDAAPEDCVSISFGDYLALFKKTNK